MNISTFGLLDPEEITSYEAKWIMIMMIATVSSEGGESRVSVTSDIELE